MKIDLETNPLDSFVTWPSKPSYYIPVTTAVEWDINEETLLEAEISFIVSSHRFR